MKNAVVMGLLIIQFGKQVMSALFSNILPNFVINVSNRVVNSRLDMCDEHSSLLTYL